MEITMWGNGIVTLSLQLSNEELYKADGNLEKQQQKSREHEQLTQKAKSMEDSRKGQEVIFGEFCVYNTNHLTTKKLFPY
jgi:hypothetical protein